MPCGSDGGDDDDDVGDVIEPKWWNRIEPIERPDGSNSFMSKVSDTLGDAIDLVSDLIVSAAILLSAAPVHLVTRLTGHNLSG